MWEQVRVGQNRVTQERGKGEGSEGTERNGE